MPGVFPLLPVSSLFRFNSYGLLLSLCCLKYRQGLSTECKKRETVASNRIGLGLSENKSDLLAKPIG